MHAAVAAILDQRRQKPFLGAHRSRPVDLASFLSSTIVISRQLVNAYFIIMALIALTAIVLAWRTRFKWLSLYVWFGAFLIGLVWEGALLIAGWRTYGFVDAAEMLYHALTEGGPGLVITILFMRQLGVIDIERFRDPGTEPTGGDAPGHVPPEGVA